MVLSCADTKASTWSGLHPFVPTSQQHGCGDDCLCAQAWQYTDNTVEGFTEAVTSVCLGSLDSRFQTHSVRLLDTLMAAVEHDFHGELPAAMTESLILHAMSCWG